MVSASKSISTEAERLALDDQSQLRCACGHQRAEPRRALAPDCCVGIKVVREEIVALLVALRCFIAGDYRADILRCDAYLRSLGDGHAGVRGVKPHLVSGIDEDRFGLLALALDEADLGVTAFEVSRRG
jgi:hypothetical protein